MYYNKSYPKSEIESAALLKALVILLRRYLNMTSREAYVFGWVFGRLNAESYPDQIGGDISLACARPYSANAKVIFSAQQKRLLTAEIDAQIGEALAEITSVDPPMAHGSEKHQPLEIQSSWQLGYYAGKGKRPLAAADFDIASARKAKKMTQVQLADAMGVEQAVISRWESGKVCPNKENLAKLKEILG